MVLQSLKLHVLKLSESIQELKLQLVSYMHLNAWFGCCIDLLPYHIKIEMLLASQDSDEGRSGDDSSLLDVNDPVDSTNSLLPSEKDDGAGNDSAESNHSVGLIEPFSSEPVSEGVPSSVSTCENGDDCVCDNKSKVKVSVSSLRSSSSYTVVPDVI